MTVDRDLPVIRANIGFVPTGAELYEEMTPWKLLRYLAELKGGASDQELEELLTAFNLTALRGQKIKTLAHGVRQRIALAQAFIGSPSYLFLDEPLNALDSLERLAFIRLLSSYAHHRTVIVSTHELNEWEAWADRVLWLERGRVQFYGSTAEWTASLPLSIWEGSVDANHYRETDPASLIHFRAEENGYGLRVMAKELPFPGFTRQNVSLEDAYFIRCRSLAL
jgi:ABC-type multidrug transport system ATPase subunit